MFLKIADCFLWRRSQSILLILKDDDHINWSYSCNICYSYANLKLQRAGLQYYDLIVLF